MRLPSTADLQKFGLREHLAALQRFNETWESDGKKLVELGYSPQYARFHMEARRSFREFNERLAEAMREYNDPANRPATDPAPPSA